jgi:signal transduction histidine kinase/DNA-binding response OmpR family regulator
MLSQRSAPTAGDVLIVDDTPANLRLLSQMLAERGYKARAVSSGARALNAVRAHPPDLILLDIMMPEIDGYEVCRRIKEDGRARDIPILFISALDTTEDKVNAFLAGGVDYITKPFQLEEVVARVETHLRLRDLQKQLQAKNAQLEREFAEQRRLDEALRSHAERLEIMHEIDQSILAARSAESIVIATVDRIRQLIPCQRVTVVQCTEDGQIEGLAAESMGDVAPAADTSVYQEMIASQSLRNGRVQGAQDLGALQHRSPPQQALYAEGIRSYVVVPLHTQDELLGALYLESARPAAFRAEHIDAAVKVAALLAVAIRQARLYERAQKEILERKQAEAALRQQAVELEAQNAELDAFAHTVAHDLKTPITSLIGYSELLDKRHAEMPEENLVQCLNTIAANGRKMTNIIDELLLLASVRKRDEVRMEPLDMAAIVAEVQARLGDLIAEHRAEVVSPATWPVAVGHGPWVEEVWVNYFSNAIKYGGRPPRIEMGATAHGDDAVRFWVRDNGPGLEPERQARLFVPFERLEQARGQGHGLGLSIVQRIVKKLGGQVGVESDGVPGQGCTFYFTLARVQG